MRRIAFFAVLAMSSVSFADEGARLRLLAAANSAPDVVPEKERTPPVVPPTPYAQTGAAVAAPALPRVMADDGLRHANLELRIQNTKLVTEAGANKKALEQQNQNLITLANQVSALSGELRTKEVQLAAVRATGQAEERKNAELEQKLADGDSRLFNELLTVLVLLAAFVAAIMVLVIMAARNTAAVMKRLPNETSKEYVDGVGTEFEAQAEAHQAALNDLRSLAREEKARADRLFEEVLALKDRNGANVLAMLMILEEVSRDFSGMLQEEKRKFALLLRKFEEVVEIAEFRSFEIDGLRKRLRHALDQQASSDQKAIVPEAGSPQDDFGINPDEGALEPPADLVAAPGAEPTRGTTAMAVVEDAEEAGRLAERILETRGSLLPEGEAVTHGGSEPKI